MATKIKPGLYRTQVLVSRPGTPRRYRSFYEMTADQADYEALTFKKEMQMNAETAKLPLEEAVKKYIELRRPALSPSTIAGYEKIVRSNLGDLGKIPLKDISYIDVQKAVNALCKDHSPKTARNVLGLITPTLRIFGNKEVRDVVVPKAEKKESHVPDADMLRQIFSRAVGTPLEVPILLAAWLSLRLSEILGLRWPDIKSNCIEVNKALVYDGQGMTEKSPKTELSRRRILCPPLILEKINELPRVGPRLFPGWTTNKLSKMYSRFLSANNLPHSRFHDLRHANASAMLVLGIPDKYAMERGGWSNLKTMRDRYQHTFSKEQQAVAERIDEYFAEIYGAKRLMQQ